MSWYLRDGRRPVRMTRQNNKVHWLEASYDACRLGNIRVLGEQDRCAIATFTCHTKVFVCCLLSAG